MDKNSPERNYLLQRFNDVLQKHVDDDSTRNEIFEEIEKKYSSNRRGYHNFNHIFYMVKLWDRYKDRLGKRDEIFISILYHDIVYNSKRSDNEERSAKYFIKHCLKYNFKFSHKQIKFIGDAILATKHNESVKHFYENDNDIKYFLDFDLYVLSAEENVYEAYRQGVRKEYKIYPDFLYKPGRKKVLESFLQRDRIYLTDDIKTKRENFARNNLQNEINLYLC